MFLSLTQGLGQVEERVEERAKKEGLRSLFRFRVYLHGASCVSILTSRVPVLRTVNVDAV